MKELIEQLDSMTEDELVEGSTGRIKSALRDAKIKLKTASNLVDEGNIKDAVKVALGAAKDIVLIPKKSTEGKKAYDAIGSLSRAITAKKVDL
jgi:hypothetical protein